MIFRNPHIRYPKSLECSLFAALDQPRRFHPLRPGREGRRRTAPAQRLDFLEERRIGAQRREFLEEQRELALFAENVSRKFFDLTVVIQKLRGGPGADPGDAGITVGRIAHEREQVRNERRIDAELFAHRGRIANDFAPAVDLHNTRPSHALRQILIGRPDRDAFYFLVLRREMRGRSERIIGFELDHRPDDHAHRRQRLLERMELREQRALDAVAGLVVRPKPIAKRLDHVIGRDAEIRFAALVLDYLENSLQYTDNRAVRAVDAT